MNIKTRIDHSKLIVLMLSLSAFSTVHAGEVISTFSSGDTLTAAQMTEIKDAVNDNDARIDAGAVDTLAGLSCAANQVAKWNGSSWACAADVDTDTNTDTLTSLSCAANQVAKWNGSSWACAADDNTAGTVFTGGTGIDVTGTTISISTGGVTSTELAADAVTATEIANNAVGLTEVNADAINSSKIVDGSIVAADIDNTSVQQRLNMACAAGSYIRDIAEDGTPTCEIDSVGTGDITGVTAGTGLTGGGSSGAVTLNLAPVTEIIALPAEAFMDQGGGPVSTSSGNGGATRLTIGSGAMVAPLYFPNGAVITNITVFVEDNAVGDFSISLVRRGFTANGFTFLDTVSTSGTSTAIQTLDGGALSVTVNNSTSNYSIRAFSSAWPGDLSLRINGALVTYTN